MTSVAAMNNMGKYAYNPRGNLWANDDSTFGHKLLMKMGWRKGKGLGKHENGIKEHIKVKLKGNNSGVGWKDESYFNIQNVEYESVLKKINAACSSMQKASNASESNTEDCKSLEKRSETFKNRLNYRKFIRGKDMSRYSEKDLKSIFIHQNSDDKAKCAQSDSPHEEEKEPNSGNKLQNLTETYNSKLSVADYFSQKMKEKASKMGGMNQIKPEKVDTVDAVQFKSKEPSLLKQIFSKKERKMAERQTSANGTLEDDNTELSLLFKKSPKKKKDKSKSAKCEEYQTSSNEVVILEAENTESSLLQKKSHKRSKKISEDTKCEEHQTSSNEAVTLNGEDTESSLLKKKSKKRKKKFSEDTKYEEHLKYSDEVLLLEAKNTENSSMRKKKKSESADFAEHPKNSDEVVLLESENTESSLAHKNSSKRKKKKSESTDCEVMLIDKHNQAKPDENVLLESENTKSLLKQKSSKKRKLSEISESEDEVMILESGSFKQPLLEQKLSKKEKKRGSGHKMTEKHDQTNPDENVLLESKDTNTLLLKQKSSKKRKLAENSESGGLKGKEMVKNRKMLESWNKQKSCSVKYDVENSAVSCEKIDPVLLEKDGKECVQTPSQPVTEMKDGAAKKKNIYVVKVATNVKSKKKKSTKKESAGKKNRNPSNSILKFSTNVKSKKKKSTKKESAGKKYSNPVKKVFTGVKCRLKESASKKYSKPSNSKHKVKESAQKKSRHPSSSVLKRSTNFKHKNRENKRKFINPWKGLSETEAMKTARYKNLLSNMEEHFVFKTTNLLSIKGYGYWGF